MKVSFATRLFFVLFLLAPGYHCDTDFDDMDYANDTVKLDPDEDPSLLIDDLPIFDFDSSSFNNVTTNNTMVTMCGNITDKAITCVNDQGSVLLNHKFCCGQDCPVCCKDQCPEGCEECVVP